MKTRTSVMLAGVVGLCLFLAGIAGRAQEGKQGKRAVGPPLPPSPPSDMFVKRMVMNRFTGIDEEEVTKFMQTYFPLELNEYRKLVTWKPDDAMNMLTDLVQESLSLMQTKQRDEALFEMIMEKKALQRKADHQAKTARMTKGAERKTHEDELKQTVDRAFDVRQKLLQEDIAHMEQQLEKLKMLAEKRKENRDVIVARRVGDLMGEGEYLEW